MEIKEWLDLSRRDVAADFARELLALANHGGGTLLFGFKEEPTGCVPAGPCPFDDNAYSQDSINNLCKRYAEPSFHCAVHRLASSLGHEHVVVEVPGGHRVPVRSRRGGPDGSRLTADQYYVRRPGPESAPVGSGQEWDTLLRRCLSAQKEDLLDSFRAIVNTLGAEEALGVLAAPTPAPLDAWRQACVSRLEELVAEELGTEAGNPYSTGAFSAAYRVLDPGPEPGPRELMKLVEEAAGHETGWPVWVVLTRADFTPYPLGGLIECWIKHSLPTDTAHADFWRISPRGEAFLLRGLQEDRSDRVEPGTVLDLTLPTWRTGECLLHAARLTTLLGGSRVEFSVEWSGLRGRELAVLASRDRFISATYTCREDRIRTVVEADAARIADTLPELVQALVAPLYASFDFFQPPSDLYAQELAQLRR